MNSKINLIPKQINTCLGINQNQFTDIIYAPLIARLDALITLDTEKASPMESWLALNQHWSNGSVEGALYYSVKALRFFGDPK